MEAKALKVLRKHYQGNGKPRVIALYTELTSLRKGENETTTDYIIYGCLISKKRPFH